MTEIERLQIELKRLQTMIANPGMVIKKMASKQSAKDFNKKGTTFLPPGYSGRRLVPITGDETKQFKVKHARTMAEECLKQARMLVEKSYIINKEANELEESKPEEKWLLVAIPQDDSQIFKVIPESTYEYDMTVLAELNYEETLKLKLHIL